MIIVVSTTISIRNALLRWLWVGCAGQGLRPVKVFEQPAPRCRKPQCIRQPPRGVEPPPVPRPIARMPGSRTARLVRSPAITCRRPAQSPSILCGGRSPDGKIAESANHRSREGLVQVQRNCRVSHWAVAEGHLSPPIFGECHYARPDPVFLWLGRRNDQEQRGDNRGKYDDIHKECTFAVAMGRLRRSRPSARKGIRATCAALPEASVYPPATARCGTTPGTQANRTNARVANRSARSFPRNHMQEACSEPLDLVWWAQPGRQDSGIRESSVEGGIGAGSEKLQGQPLGCCRGTPEPTHFWGVPLC